MARGEQQELRCRNSWRPSDRRPTPNAEEVPRLRSTEPHLPFRRSSSIQPQPNSWMLSDYSERSTSATPESPAQTFKNPNLIPVVPRRLQVARPSSPEASFQQDKEHDGGRLPQIWNPSIDDLIRRTAHDHDLVMNYERDAEGGQRWLPEDVATIRKVGKNLHRDIFALKHWQWAVAEQGDRDKDMMIQIKRAANLVKLQCERVQKAINKYEQKCEFELLRDGVYAQDEDGNFYRPIVLQQHVAEDEVPQSTYPSTEYGGARSSEYHHDYQQDRDEDSRRQVPKPQAAPENLALLQPLHTKAFDSTFETASPNDRIEIGYARQRFEATHLPTLSRSDKVLDGRISKPYPTPPSAHQRHVSSPTRHAEYPSSKADLPLEVADKKPRNRGRNNKYERDGRSRRQAKKDREQDRSPRPTAGRLGKHVLHY